MISQSNKDRTTGNEVSNDVISHFFTDMAKKHNVKVEDLNLHVCDKTLQVQEYTPGQMTEYKPLETIPLND